MNSSAELPPFHVIAAALRTTTERLVGEVVNPQSTAPDWNNFEWAVARAVCAMQGISGLLATRLTWSGPATFRDFLTHQHAHMLARDAQVGQLLANLDVALRDAGIAFIPLKGSAIRELRLHQAGERSQSDVDMLVDPEVLSACAAPLEKLGYRLSFTSRRHDVYEPTVRAKSPRLGEHPDNALKIEVHAAVAEALPVEPVDITASLLPRQRSPGANSYASLAALMRHTCLHAAGNMRANAMRFIQIYEIAQLARRMSPADWGELIGSGADRTGAWWLFPPLALAARYVPGSVPAHLLAELQCQCPRRLRDRYERVSIYEVSWSNLRIPALPGREWSRTPGDTLRFARSRLFPSRVALDELAVSKDAAPQLKQVRWYGASHFERVLRWLFTRPPRVQTITAVSAALQESA